MKNTSFFRKLLFLIGCTYLTSCGFDHKVLDANAYLDWYKESIDDRSIEKKVNKLLLSAQYIPADYKLMMFKDWKQEETIHNVDSLQSISQHMVTFELKILPENPSGNLDLMFNELNDYSDYDQRMKDLSFQAKKQFELHTDQGDFEPVLSHFENNIGLSHEKTITVVFSTNVSVDELGDLQLVWSDRHFNTGKHHFSFSGKTIHKFPSLNYKTLMNNDQV